MNKQDRLLHIYAAIVGANYAKDVRMRSMDLPSYFETAKDIMRDYLTWAEWAVEEFYEKT